MSAPEHHLHRCRDFHYRLLAPASSACARIAFEGRFEGRAVCWQVTLVTLAFERTQASPPPRRSFIEIDPAGPSADGRLHACVGLDVIEIDAATICKSLIMLNKYKRLRRGRMEFGEPSTPAGPPE